VEVVLSAGEVLEVMVSQTVSFTLEVKATISLLSEIVGAY